MMRFMAEGIDGAERAFGEEEGAMDRREIMRRVARENADLMRRLSGIDGDVARRREALRLLGTEGREAVEEMAALPGDDEEAERGAAAPTRKPTPRTR